MPQIFLSASSSQGLLWADPGDWNPSNNKVECLGSGGSGAPGVYTDHSGGGGGGGAYAVGINLNPTFPVKYNCMLGTSTGGYYTAFGMGASFDGSDGLVRARQGRSGAEGGTAGNVFYPAGYSGGAGGIGSSSTGWGGGGGGGAAGPMGAGGNGGPGAAGSVGGLGGNADGNTVVGTSGPGTFNQRWDQFHGCGAGGGGASDSRGNAGGAYGGGGGGGANSSFSQFRGAGAGQDGLIIINYTPLLKSAAGFNMPMMGL